MVKVNPQHVMALRRLTDQPVSACRDALAQAGGDLAAVVQRLRESACGGLYASDAEVAAVLASYGVTWAPPERQARSVPDAEVVAELAFGGQAVADFFLLSGLVCHVNAGGELMCRAIDDPDLAVATTAYLRRAGVREFESLAEFQVWRSQAESGAAPDPATSSDL